jgi:hypothetical protein
MFLLSSPAPLVLMLHWPCQMHQLGGLMWGGGVGAQEEGLGALEGMCYYCFL